MIPMQAKYHPEAKNEIQEAIKWYDRKSDGLGLEFIFEVRQDFYNRGRLQKIIVFFATGPGVRA